MRSHIQIIEFGMSLKIEEWNNFWCQWGSINSERTGIHYGNVFKGKLTNTGLVVKTVVLKNKLNVLFPDKVKVILSRTSLLAWACWRICVLPYSIYGLTTTVHITVQSVFEWVQKKYQRPSGKSRNTKDRDVTFYFCAISSTYVQLTFKNPSSQQWRYVWKYKNTKKKRARL